MDNKKNQNNLLSPDDYQKIAYSVLKNSGMYEYKDNVDAVDYIAYHLMRNDLRYDSTKFNSLTDFRNKCSKRWALQKFINAKKQERKYITEQLSPTKSYNQNFDDEITAREILESTELNELESSIIELIYYRHHTKESAAKQLKMDCDKLTNIHNQIIERMRDNYDKRICSNN